MIKIVAKLNVLFFLFFLNFNSLNAQSYTSVEIPIENNGYSATFDKTILEDTNGFIWYSTFGGLIKETGFNSTFFSFDHPTGQKSIKVLKLYLSKNGKIWGLTRFGAFYLDIKTGEKNWIIPKKDYKHVNSKLEFMSIFEDKDGTIWFGTNDKYLYSYGKDEKISIFPLKIEYGFNNIEAEFITQLPNNVFLLKLNNDFYVFDKKKLELVFNSPIVDKTKSDYSIKCFNSSTFFKDRKSGTYLFKGKTYKYHYVEKIGMYMVELPFKDKSLGNNFYTNNVVYSINNDLIKIASFSKKDKQFRLKVNDTVKIERNIWDFLIDKDKDIWIIDEKGLTLYKKGKNDFLSFLKNTRPSKSSSRGFTKTTKGNIYHNTIYNLYLKGKSKESKFERIYLKKQNTGFQYGWNQDKYNWEQYIYSIYQLNDSTLIAYGYFPGIIKINLNTLSKHKIPVSKKIKPVKDFKFNISDIEKISENELLLASDEGLWIFNLVKQSFEKKDDLIQKGVKVKDLQYESDKNVLWLGTFDNGLFRKDLNSNSEIHYSTTSSEYYLSDNRVEYIYTSSKNFIWIATYNGLQKINKKSLKSEKVYINENLKNKHIVGILESGNYLWLSTYDGLVQFNKKTNKLRIFFDTDGLNNNEFNSKSFFKENDTSFYFGGINGVNQFNPTDFDGKQLSPKIYLNSITKFNSVLKKNDTITFNLDSIKEIKLPYNHNFLFMTFDLNDIKFSDKSFFNYRILELHSDWVSLYNSSEISFLALEPNEYTLEVKGVNSKGVESEILRYKIIVSKLFYQTFWFKILTVFALILIVSFWELDRRKKNQIKFIQKNRLASLESKALRAQMNPHFIFNALNGIQNVIFNKSEFEANKYISSFSKLLRHTLEMSDCELISLQEEISYLKAYLDLESLKFNNNLNISFTIAENINPKEIFIPCMLIQPIVENAILHGLLPKKNNRELELNFSILDSMLCVEILDNGIGRKATLNNKTESAPKSMATYIMNDRINISNAVHYNKKNELEIIDLYDNEKPIGTKVILKIII